VSQAASPGQSSARKPRWSRALGALQRVVGTAVLVGFIYYLVDRRSELDEILEASLGDLVVLALLVGVTLTINVVQNLLLIRRLDVSLRWSESFVLTLATNFGNYLPVRAGTLIVAHYLKVVHGLSYARFGSLFGIRILLTFIAIGSSGTIATLLVWANHGRLSLVLFGTFTTLAASATLILVSPLPERRERSGRVRRALEEASEGAIRLRTAPALGAFVLVTNLLQQATLVARFYFGTRALGNSPPLEHLILLAPVASLASLTALTPGALGLREAAMGAATYAIGATFTSGMLVGTLDRSVLFGVVMLLGGVCFPYVWFKIRRVERGRQRVEVH
jgi:uncharacterized membrane protein YbhN (UPF0104 family)